MDFTNRVAVVTGATSGIGEATARLLLEKGAEVLAVGRNEAKGRELEQEQELAVGQQVIE